MSITPEQARAELERRRQERADPPTAIQNITPEMAKSELARRREGRPLQDEGNSINAAAHGFNSKFEKVFHGILQPLLEGNLFNTEFGNKVTNASKEMARKREEESERYDKTNPLSSMAGGLAGEVGLALPAMLAGAPAGIPGMMLAGGIGGGLRGASEYTNEGESRLENALYESLLGSAFGAVPGLGKIGGKYVKNALGAVQPEKLAKKIIKGKDVAEKTSSKLYGDFIKQGQKSGIKVEVPKFNKEKLLKETPSNYKKLLDSWMENPDIRNTHKLSKATGKLERKLKGKIEARTITTPEENTYNVAKKMNSLVKTNLNEALDKSGRKDLKRLLNEANKHYVDKVLPHRNTLIREHIGIPGKKGSTAKDFLRDLSKQKLFRKELAELYPEVGVRRSLPYVGGGAAASAISQYLGIPSKIKDFLIPKD